MSVIALLRMTLPPTPANEPERLAALRALLILDTEPEARFDQIANFARKEFDVPIALISLVDQDRQWFKSNPGLEQIRETPRDIAFCAHAILASDTLVVPDALADECFKDNPLVTGPTGFRFYAGAPLTLPSGEAVGTLCILDTKPRDIDMMDLVILGCLRDLVIEELERHEDAH